MTSLVVHPATGPLVGSVPVPSDAGIGQRALLTAALCEGRSHIRGFSHEAAHRSMLAALRAFGVCVDEPSPGVLAIDGVGLMGLCEPHGDIDCGNSTTAASLLCAVLSAQRFRTRLVGTATLSHHSMASVVAPLRARGAVVDGQGRNVAVPLVVGPLPDGRTLAALEYDSPTSSHLAKSAVLLSGLYAAGVTRFREPSVSPDHTERLLASLGCPLRTVATVVELDPSHWDRRLPAFDMMLPGDISAASLLVAAAQFALGSRITIRGVGTNPTRSGLLEVARDMGAGLAVESKGDRSGEPVAELHAWSAPLHGISVGGETVVRAWDEIPVACALAARAHGTTRLRDIEEQRQGAEGRLACLARVLAGFGVACGEHPGGLDIDGREGSLIAADVDSQGDDKIAMTATLLALAGEGPSRVRSVDGIAATYPKFVATLRALGARIEVEA